MFLLGKRSVTTIAVLRDHIPELFSRRDKAAAELRDHLHDIEGELERLWDAMERLEERSA